MRGSPASKNWSQHWFSGSIIILATFQLFTALGMAGMEIGNTLVDAYNSNVYSGFWSFPFMLAAVIATYVSACAKTTQKKAVVALIFQSIAILVILIAIGFLIAFIVTGFDHCIGFQCGQTTGFYSSSNSRYLSLSSDQYYLMKKIFISVELAFAVIFLLLAIVYIYLFIICMKTLHHTNRQKLKIPFEDLLSRKSVVGASPSPPPTPPLKPMPMLNTRPPNSNDEPIIHQPSTITVSPFGARQVCPKCGHIAPYNPDGNTVQCPKCSYESKFVQHARKK